MVHLHTTRCIVSTIDIAYLALILFAFVGFASVLAYYNQTCAEPSSRQSEPAVKRPQPATAH
jgi:hypothetical protein